MHPGLCMCQLYVWVKITLSVSIQALDLVSTGYCILCVGARAGGEYLSQIVSVILRYELRMRYLPKGYLSHFSEDKPSLNYLYHQVRHKQEDTERPKPGQTILTKKNNLVLKDITSSLSLDLLCHLLLVAFCMVRQTIPWNRLLKRYLSDTIDSPLTRNCAIIL